MLAAAAGLSGAEKAGLHTLVRAAPNVVDVEIALPGSSDVAQDADGPDASGAELGVDATNRV